MTDWLSNLSICVLNRKIQSHHWGDVVWWAGGWAGCETDWSSGGAAGWWVAGGRGPFALRKPPFPTDNPFPEGNAAVRCSCQAGGGGGGGKRWGGGHRPNAFAYAFAKRRQPNTFLMTGLVFKNGGVKQNARGS